jgi:MFS family permease
MAAQLPADASPSELPWPPASRAWFMIGVLTLAYIFSFVDRMIFGLLITPIRAEFDINDTVFSLLYGWGFAFFYTVLGVPIGWAADRYNRRNLAVAGIALWSLMTAACGLAKSFGQLALARIAVGVGEASLTPATYSMAGDSFPPHKLGRALSVFIIGWPLGAGLALIIGGLVIQLVAESPIYTMPILGDMKSWQACFIVVGLPGVLIALLALTLPEPVRRTPKPTAGGSTIAETVRHLTKHWQAYTSLVVGYSMFSIVMTTYNLWGVQVFVRVHGLAISQAGLWVGSLFAIFGTLGIVTGGLLHDRLRARGSSDAALRVGVLAAVVMLPSAASSTLVASPQLAIVLMLPIGFFCCFGFGASGAAIVTLTPPHLRGVMSAFYVFTLNMIAMGFGPMLTALVTDGVFHDDLAVGKSVAIVASVALIAATVLLSWGKPHFRALADTIQTT